MSHIDSQQRSSTPVGGTESAVEDCELQQLAEMEKELGLEPVAQYPQN